MGILSRLFGIKSKAPDIDGPPGSAERWLDWTVLTGQPDTAENPYVYRCKELRATAVSSLHPIVYDRDGNELKDHPLRRVLEMPNPTSTWRQLIYDVQVDLATWGNAFILPITTIKGVSELWRIPADRVAPEYTGDIFHLVSRWIVNSGKNTLYVRPEDIIHIHTQLNAGGVMGISPLAAAKMSISNQNESRAWNSAILNNGAKPSLIVQDPHEMTPEQFADFKQRINAGNAGIRNAGRIVVLDDGKTASTAGFTAVDMDFANGIVLTAREIAVAFGVPPENIGDSANKTYANAQEANKEFAMHTVVPLAQMTYEPISALCRRYHPDIGSVGFDMEEIDALKGDQTAMMQALTAANYLTINEKRARMSYEDIPGGDVVLQPLGQAPLDEVATDIDSIMGQEET